MFISDVSNVAPILQSSSKLPASRSTENGNDASDTLESQQNADISRFDWKDLIPVVKVEISMVIFFFFTL